MRSLWAPYSQAVSIHLVGGGHDEAFAECVYGGFVAEARAHAEARTATLPRIAVIAMGRWGGRELSYASDADAMFVMEDGITSAADPTKVAGAVITELRTLLARPSADPALAGARLGHFEGHWTSLANVARTCNK